MGALTHESLVEYLLEEAFEVAETIETGADEAELRGELGDVLLQVVLHARLAEERGSFAFDDVARGLSAKMVRRNPHVFRPDGSLQDTFPATVEEIVRKWDCRQAGRDSRSAGIPSKGFRTRFRPWPGPRSPWTGPSGPEFRQAQPPALPLVELSKPWAPRRSSASCSSPRRLLHGPGIRRRTCPPRGRPAVSGQPPPCSPDTPRTGS